jgi:hypothetical protein
MKRLAGFVVGATALAVLMSSCGTPIRINGAEVDKDVPFLGVVEQRWREQAGSDRYSTSAEVTHCWLARERKSGAVASHAFCGPIRHLADVDQQGVFDEMEFTPVLLGDKQVEVKPESVEMVSEGVDPPAGVDLYHPSGDKPAKSASVPMPEAPRADSGVVAIGDDSEIQNPRKPEYGALIVPGGEVRITKTGTVARLSGGEDVPYYQPAVGEELLAFTFRVSDNSGEDANSSSDSVDTSRTFSIRSAKGLVNLASVTGEGADTQTLGTPATTVIVSVPIGQDAELLVGVAGVDQSLSIRTGTRTSTTAEAYYLPQTTFAVQKQFSTRKATKGDFEVTHGVTFTDAWLSPFNSNTRNGWAPQGQMYLSLSYDNASTDKTGSNSYVYADPTYDRNKSIKIVGTGGEMVRLLSTLPYEQGYNSAGTILVQLPVTTKGVSVTYGPRGHFAVSSFYSSSDVSPDSGSFAFKPETFKIDFSG